MKFDFVYILIENHKISPSLLFTSLKEVVEISCESTFAQWYHNGNSLPSNVKESYTATSSKITIFGVHDFNEGYYICLEQVEGRRNFIARAMVNIISKMVTSSCYVLCFLRLSTESLMFLVILKNWINFTLLVE